MKDMVLGYKKLATNSHDIFKDYVKTIKNYRATREMLVFIQEMYLGILNKENIFELSEKCRKQLADAFSVAGTTKTAKDIIDEFHSHMMSTTKVVKSGYPSLDKIIHGFEPGSVTVIAGRPSMGKTAFGVNLFNNMINQGYRVPFFSIEMATKQMMKRLIAVNLGEDLSNLRSKDFYLDYKDKIRPIFKRFMSNHYIMDDETNKLEDMINKIRQYKVQYNIDAVIIDYLQLIKFSNNSRTREQEVSYISQAIKNDIAKDLDIPVILLAQLSRATEQNKANRPQMSHLRESGAIENDADNIILLHRPDYYDPNTMSSPNQTAEIIVAKGRNCGTGITELNFALYTNRFEEISDSLYDNIKFDNGEVFNKSGSTELEDTPF